MADAGTAKVSGRDKGTAAEPELASRATGACELPTTWQSLHTPNYYASVAACVVTISPCIGSLVFHAVKVGSLDTKQSALACLAGALRLCWHMNFIVKVWCDATL